MENSNLSRNFGGGGGGVNSSNNRHDDQHHNQQNRIGVNNQSHKIGKNIRKSPMHQPNFPNPKQQQPQPLVYNISKNEFRNIVQQLTGSPAPHDSSPSPAPHARAPTPPPAPYNQPKPPSMRLQKIRPPPLSPITRPQIPHPAAQAAPFQNPNSPFFGRPGNSPYLGTSAFSPLPPLTPGDAIWAANVTAESPISAYMRYLQNSILDSNPRPLQQPSSSGLLPTPTHPVFPSPRSNGPALLPSPTSQFGLFSPSSFLHLPSPGSPFPLLSPRFQLPFPTNSHFSLTPPSQSGILGPGPQVPPSSGLLLPLSPSGMFPASSPRWRDE